MIVESINFQSIIFLNGMFSDIPFFFSLFVSETRFLDYLLLIKNEFLKNMGKMIRHLEFYGFPDQNVFNSITNVDLSGIKEVNKDQDREISEISGQTQNKADLGLVLELSGKVDTFIENQSLVNEGVIESLSSMTDTINDIADLASSNEQAISGFNDTLSEHIEKFNEFKDYADDTYAKKVDVYTKEEADEKFLSSDQDLSKYALKDDLEALQEQVDSLDDEYATKEELSELREEFSGLSESVDESIASITSSITSVEEDMEELKEIVASSATDVEESLAEMSRQIADKVSSEQLGVQVNRIYDTIDEVSRNKVDKSEFSSVTATVQSISEGLANEAAERESADLALSGELSSVRDAVSSVSGIVTTVSGGVADLSAALDAERTARENGDITLVGNESDTALSDTIWGAKKYADAKGDSVLIDARAYADEKLSGIDTLIDNKMDEFDTKLSGKADKTYVDELVDERVAESENTINTRIDSEVSDLNRTDGMLSGKIAALEAEIDSVDLKDVYKRINVITTYSGDTAEEYVNTGNGILDVLHREFHQLEDEINIHTNPTLVRTNEYESSFGRFNASSTGSEPSERTIFSVGIGTGNFDRKNAIEVRENGDIYMWVENEFMPINDLLAMLAHENY